MDKELNFYLTFKLRNGFNFKHTYMHIIKHEESLSTYKLKLYTTIIVLG